STSLELGPVHSARPMSVATAGRFAAWGYTDGVVIAIDTQSNTTWKFSGHRYSAAYIAIDEKNERLISAAGDEIRVWPLTPSPLVPVGHVPCTVYNLAPSLDQTQTLFDCDDGGVRL